jgi:predicted nucleotidyltransferase
MSNLSPIYRKNIPDLKSLIFERLKEENFTVILLGSRAREDFSRVSDINIGFFPGKTLIGEN